MAVYKIYHKDGSILSDANGKEIEVHSIEYNGTWMGECFVTVTFENEAPISFSIGDYIEYRGERFEINYDPGKIKCASKDSYGGAFKYDSVKFNALSDELVRCDMLDLVLYDNKLHYTALPQFTFYVESLDDLLDRIQANLDELYGKASWKLYSRNKQRSIQRGGLESEWNSVYGEGTADNVIDSTSISISDQTCWDALSLVNSQFDVNFIIRNRNVYVGTAGMPTSNIFKYGKDKGLYEIEQNSESDQAIVTRLRAYGSNRNLPNHYYADLGSVPFLNITGDYHEGSTENGLSVMMEDSTYAGMFTDIISDNGTIKHCSIRGSIDGYEFDGTLELVKKNVTRSTTRLLAEGKEVSDAIKAKIDAGIVEVDFIRGANKAKFDGNRINYVSNLPNNMACDRLMLPGFPNKSLKEWWDAQSAEKKVWLNPSGKKHIFSNDIYRPYVDSLNIKKIGVRPSSVFFDQDDKVNGIVEIYPTIEEMEVDGVRIDEIYTGTNVEDDGRFGDDVSDIANVAIYLSPKINFDIRGLMQDDFTIHMKDGMCAGREFKVAGCTKQNDGSWKLMIERKPDDSLNLYFPYNDFQIKKGDHFVLSGIELPDAYVEAASEKLLRYCIAYLDKNDYTRYVYQPKVDEIFMARQHDTAMADASGLTKSLYLTLKEGDIMLFKDDDLGIDAEITIDQLTIKEEDGKIPTYEITLREEKEVGTIQKIQNQISSITNGNGGSLSGATGGGLSSSQIKNLIDAIGSDRFLSKLNPDTAAGIITFLQGTNWGNFTSESGAAMSVDPTTGQTYMEVDRLKVRLKAFFEQLEVQKVGYVGGKIVVSKGQGVDILDVEEVFDSEGNLSAYRCYFLGEQEGRRIDNLLRVDDQMICKDENISEGSTDGATNKYYWRLATAVSSDVVKRGNNVCHWVDLSATDYDTISDDVPEIGDTICQLGNRNDIDRQGAEVLSVVDANSPSFTIYAGIDSYSLVNKEYIDMGVSEGKAYCNIYGSTYIGDRERKTGYLRWNDDTKTFEIKGTIDISSPLSSGGTIGGAISSAANAYKDDFSSFTSNVNEIIGGFQKQIDGVIETWFYDPEPKLDNLPASEWKDNDTKDKHLGDLYYSKDGLAYRFQKEGDIYKWVQIDDTAITSALKEAKAAKDAAAAAQGTADSAQTTANSKMKVFVKQPTNNDEYSIGDMWVNATYPADGSTYNNEILHCVTDKAAGEAFSISHWAQSSNIKTQFNNFVNNTYAEDKKDFYNQLDGKVETWYQSADPKDKWEAADYSKHKGDIWYNDSTNKSYRWMGTAWVELKDQAAIDAKALAESKRRVFTTTTLPTPPYDARDLWVQGENGDIMVCVTPKAAGTTASASDWEKASKYTDDTKAKEALTKVGDLQTDVTELGDSFVTLTDVTLPAISDGIITTSEKENIRQALMQVQKECVDVINAYANLTVNYKSIYDNIAADVRTNFATAYTNLMGSATLSSDGTITYTSGQGGAYGALVDNINALLNKEGNLTTNEIATINNNIANFNIKYNDFQNRLVVVRNDIEKTLDTRITKVDEQLGGYAYLKKIVGGKTTIDGGLVLTTMLGTGYEVTGGAYKIMSGISGLYEKPTSVAIWAGGSMIDKFVYYDAESGKFNVPDDVNPANFLVRMDGTGYAAGGNFWWDNDGKIHADPQSFLINEQYVGNVMQLFELHYKVAGDTAFTNVDYVTPTRMFNGLELSDLGLKIGDTAKFYIKDGVLFLEGDLAVTGGITMYASDGVKSGMIDQVYAVLDQSLFSIVDGAITITGEIGSGTVKGIAIKGTQYDPDANGIIALTLNWGDLTGVPTTFTPSAHNHNDLYYTETEIDTKLAGKSNTGHTHDDRYYIKSDIDTKLGLKLDTSLKGTANGLATLDASGKVPSAQLPSYVDDVLECINKASFPTTGESGKIYIDQTTNLTYRWGGTAYVEISQSLALGETSSTAYAGDKGKQNAADIAALKTGKADKATTLAGYGITDAYTKAEVNTKLTDGSVTKVGKVDVGSATKPIYLKAGVPTAVGTSLAVDITGNSATTSKLKTAVTLWGQSFDGSKAISGAITGASDITMSGALKLNGITIEKTSNGLLKINGDLIVTGGITMYASDGVSSGLMEQILVDGVTIGKNSDGALYAINTGNVRTIKMGTVEYTPNDSGVVELPAKVTWDNIDGKPSTFAPSAHTHTFASLTSKPTTIAGYGITDAKIVNGVITLGTATITPLTAHQTVTLASGTNNGTLKLTVNGTATDNIAVKGLGSAAYTNSSAYAAASHTHSQYLVASSLDGYVNALTDNTSTNVFVTAIAKSGKTLSYTKSFTKKSLTAASHSGWSSVDTDKLIIPDMSFIAYWNGAYNSNGGSNLAYCNKGAFGDMATASKSSYYTKSDTYTKTEVNTKLTDGSVTKVGTANVGATNIPIYLKAGVPTAVTLVDTANNLINNLTTGTSTPEDADYYVAQYVGGGTTTTTFHRRPHSALYAYIKGKAEGTWAISVSGNAATATTLQTARTLWGQSFNGSANISGNMWGVGQITFSALSGTNGRALLYQQMADNDFFRIYAGGTGNNGGYAEIATADDGNEPIYVRQYSGVFGTLVRTLTLLDGNGNTTVPGLLTAANGTVNGTLKVGTIPVTNSSTGVLKIDGNLIVTGGITMYATDGVASGLMEQILVDGTTIGKKADGTLYAINTGNVRSIIMGSTTYTPNDSGAVTLPEKVTWANIEGKPSTFAPSSHTHAISQITNLQATLDGKAAASHTHSYLPLSGGKLTGNLEIDSAVSSHGEGIRIHAASNGWCGVVMCGSDNTGSTGTSAKTWGIQSKDGSFYINRNSDADVTSAYILCNVNGNWGMGTNSPSYKLHVAGDIYTTTGFKKSGSSDSYVLLGGGGHKAVSDFATSGHTHSYLPYIRSASVYDANTIADGWADLAAVPSNVPTSNHGSLLTVTNVGTPYQIWIPDNQYYIYKRFGTSGVSSGSWFKLYAGYADSSGNADTLDGYHASAFALSGHTHSYLPLSGGTMSGYIHAPNTGIIFYGSVGATTGAYITGSSEGVYINGFKYVTLESSSVNYHPRVRLNTVDYPLLSTYNYNSYVPTLTGTGASGTWGISITGNSDTVDGWHLSEFHKSAYVTSSTGGLSSYWGKLWDITITGWQYNDMDMTLLLHSSYNTRYSIVNVRLRQNGSSGAYNFSASLHILTGNISTSDMRLYYDNSTGACSLWVNCWGQWGVVNCKVLSYTMRIGSEGKPQGTFYTTDFSSTQTLPSSSYVNGSNIGNVAYASSAGNSDTCDGLHVHGGRNNEANKIVRTDGSGYLQVGYINSSNGNEGNNSSPARVWGTNGSDNYMRTYLTSALNVYTSGSVRSESGNKTTGLQYYSASGGFTKDGTGVGGAWSVPSDSVDAQYGNGQAIRMWWGSTYYTDILSGPNVWGATKGIYIRQIVSGAISAGTFTGGWRLLLDSSNYNRYVPTLTGTGASGTWAISVSGNAATATKWATARTITLTGSVTGSVSIDGSGNVSLATTTNHTHAYLPLSGGTMTGQIQRAGQGSSWIKGRDNAMIRVNSVNGYSVLSSIKTTNGSWEIGHYSADSHKDNLLFGYYPDSNYTAGTNSGCTKVTFTSGGQITATQFNGALNGNAATASAVKDLTNSRTSYLDYAADGVTSPSWLCAWNTRSDNTYEIRAISPANMLSVIKALPLAGGTMTAGARISHADGNLYLGRADNNGWVMCQDMCSQTASGDTYWSLRTNGTFHALTTCIGGHLWLNKQNASSSTGGASQLVFGLDGNQHVVISSNKGAVIINPSTSSSTGQLILRTGTSSTSEFAGNIKAGGGITMYSDLRKKNVLSDEVLSVKEIAAAPLFRHTYKSDDNQYIHVGTSAQYWSGIHEDWFTRKDSEGYYQMELQNLGVAMGISLAREIVTFEGAFKKYESKTDKKIRLMKKKINDLEARIKELEERRTA